MSTELLFVLACGVLALVYGFWASRSVLSASAGTARMQEIAGAIQEGAQAYLNRQYRAIAMVGIVVFLIVSYALDFMVGIGFLIGATLSGLTGYIGMHVSVRANVRTSSTAQRELGRWSSARGARACASSRSRTEVGTSGACDPERSRSH